MKTILIVDEESKLTNLFRLVFPEDMDYRVVRVSSGIEAILKSREIEPDVVIADVSLLDKDGYQLSKQLKNIPDLKNSYVILLISSLKSEKANSLKHSVDDLILKSSDPRDTLEDVIESMQLLITQSEESNKSKRRENKIFPA